MTKFMPLGMPQKIQKQKLCFSSLRGKTCTASYHLAIKAPHLCRPEHHHTVNRRTVPAFCKQHAVTQDVIFSIIKILQHLRPIHALAIYLRSSKACPIEHLAKLLARCDQRQEHDSLPVMTNFSHLFCNLLQIWI